MPRFKVKRTLCVTCTKSVYPLDRQVDVGRGLVYHAECIKCEHIDESDKVCGVILRANTYRLTSDLSVVCPKHYNGGGQPSIQGMKRSIRGALVQYEREAGAGPTVVPRAALDQIMRFEMVDVLGDVESAGLLPLLVESLVQKENRKMLEEVVKMGPESLDRPTRDGTTTVHLAVAKGGVESIKMLLNAGASIKADRNGNNPLHAAMKAHNMKAVEVLLEVGGMACGVNNEGKVPVQLACEARERADFATFLDGVLSSSLAEHMEAGGELLGVRLLESLDSADIIPLIPTLLMEANVSLADRRGVTPIVALVRRISKSEKWSEKDATALKMLTGLGASLNESTESGVPLLFEVLQHPCNEMLARAMIDHGVDLSSTHKGVLPMQAALSGRHLDLARHIIQLGPALGDLSPEAVQETLESIVCDPGAAGILALLREKGFTISSVGSLKMHSVLCTACTHGLDDVAVELIGHGAPLRMVEKEPVDLRSSAAFTAESTVDLRSSAGIPIDKHEFSSAVRTVLNAYFGLSVADRSTPRSRGLVQVIELLLERGEIRPDRTDSSGVSLLEHAVSKRHVTLVEALSRQGFNLSSDPGLLLRAVSGLSDIDDDNLEMLLYLCQNSANVNHVNSHGKDVLGMLFHSAIRLNANYVTLVESILAKRAEQSNVPKISVTLADDSGIQLSLNLLPLVAFCDADGPIARRRNPEIVQQLFLLLIHSMPEDITKVQVGGNHALGILCRRRTRPEFPIAGMVAAMLDAAIEEPQYTRCKCRVLNPYQQAMAANNNEVLRVLAEHRIGLNYNNNGLENPPLYEAALCAQYDTMGVMLDNGANPALLTGTFPLTMFRPKPRIKREQALTLYATFRRLLECGMKLTGWYEPILVSLMTGMGRVSGNVETECIEMMHYLLDRGVDVNEADAQGRNALFAAGRTGSASVVQELLSLGCERRLTLSGETAASVAKGAAADLLLKPYHGVCSVCEESEELAPLPPCGHALCYCCFGQWALANVGTSVPCASMQCNKSFSLNAVYDVFRGREWLERFDLSLRDNVCSRMNDFAWCTRCESGGILNFACNETICGDCGNTWCGYCGGDAHPGDECKGRVEMEAVEKWKSSNSRPCPSCGAHTEHAGGCTHVTCSRCSYGWCWACRGPYRGRYSFNLAHCPCDDPDDDPW